MRKIAGLLLLLILLSSSSAWAEETAACGPGEEVTVNLSVTENPSRAVAINMAVQYDHAALELIPSNTVQNDSTFLLNLDGIQEGTSVSVSFRVLPEAAPGDYAVTLELKEAGTIDEEFVYDVGFSTAVITVEGESEFTYIEADGEIRITGYLGADSKVTVPSTLNGLPVTAIGDKAFKGCAELQKISLPSSLRVIGNNAFQDCRALFAISMPRVLSIGNYAFYGCASLQKVYLPEVLTEIGEYAFASCQNLSYVTIPGNVYAVPKCAFMGCASLCSVTFRPGVTEIGNTAFYNCTSLREISFPETLLQIGEHAFSKCGALESVTFPESLERVKGYAFEKCGKLVSVTVPGNTSVVDGYAFIECSVDLVVSVKEGSPMHDYCAQQGIACAFIQ